MTKACLILILVLIAVFVMVGCYDGEPRRDTEAVRLTDQLVSVYEHDPQTFYSAEVGREVELTADVQHIYKNGRIELDTGEWVWYNDLECITNDNFILANVKRWDTMRVKGAIHSIEDDGEPFTKVHRVILSPCQIIKVIN